MKPLGFHASARRLTADEQFSTWKDRNPWWVINDLVESKQNQPNISDSNRISAIHDQTTNQAQA